MADRPGLQAAGCVGLTCWLRCAACRPRRSRFAERTDYNLYIGAVIDVATRYVYRLQVLTDRTAFAVWSELHEPVITSQGGLPQLFTMDKGAECWLLAFGVLYSNGNQGAGVGRGAVARQRFVNSKRHSRIEGYWRYCNPRVLLPLKLVLVQMEVDGVFDREQPVHMGAVQAIGRVLLQHACDIALRRWNAHNVLSLGGRRSLGSPSAMRERAPKLAQRVALRSDVIDEYERGSGNRLDRVPEWAGLRDPLLGDATRQRARDVAVGAALGPIEDAWADVLWGDGERFRDAFGVYVSYV